jgi:hypothetical protein
MKDLKDSFGSERKGSEQGHDDDEDAHIYKLIRGAPTVMFMKGGDESNDYVPEWDNCLEEDTSNEEEDDEMGREQEKETVHFNVTLMMNQGKQGGEDYEPKDDDDDDGVPISAPGQYGARSRSSTPSPPSLEATLQRRLQTAKTKTTEEKHE